MENFQSNQSFSDEIDQMTPIQFNVNVNSGQPSLFGSVQPQKRPRKPNKRAKKSDEQPDSSRNASESVGQSQGSSAASLSYRQSVGQTYPHPSQWYPYWSLSQAPQVSQSQHHPFLQNASFQPPFPFTFNPYSQQWLPSAPTSSTTTTAYSPFDQQRQALQNVLAMSFQRNQGLEMPARVMPEMSSQTALAQFSITQPEPESPQLDLNQWSTNSEGADRRTHERMSAFHIYGQPPTPTPADLTTGMPEQPLNTSDQAFSHSTNEESTDDTNKEGAVGAVNSVCNQNEDRNVIRPASVTDERYDFTCVICQEAKKNTVLMPCRHLCVCQKCCENIDLCPLCRKVFIDTMTVFT